MPYRIDVFIFVDMLDPRQIAPRPTDRAVLVGQTGSGKTTLAEHLCRLRRYVVVLDPKGLIKWPGYKRYTTLNGAIKAGRQNVERIVYAPIYEELMDASEMDAFFSWVYNRERCTVYVDETAAITTATDWPFHLGACLMRGRERKVETWLATQRPSRIPAIVLSESEHVYAFPLRYRPDREKVEDLTGIEEERIRGLRKRQFIYAPQEGDIQGPLKLRLTEVPKDHPERGQRKVG